MTTRKALSRQVVLNTALVVIMPLCMADGQWDSYQLDYKDVVRIESELPALPGGKDLKKYTRYYAGSLESGIYIVTAVYVAGVEGFGDVNIVPYKKLPLIFDGGCNVIKLKYNLKEKMVVLLRCNGSA